MTKKPMTMENLGDIRKPIRNDETDKSLDVLKRTGTRRRSQRTMQLNIKVTPEFYGLLSKQADKEENYMVDVLEKAFEFYMQAQQ